VSGTVLDPGESAGSARAREAIGPWYVVSYHGVWEAFPEGLAGMPGGTEWLADVESSRPDGERHLAVHRGHITHVTERDRAVLDLATDEQLASWGWVGDAGAIRDRVQAARSAGVVEILYTPSGPDIEREMRAFAAATIG